MVPVGSVSRVYLGTGLLLLMEQQQCQYLDSRRSKLTVEIHYTTWNLARGPLFLGRCPSYSNVPCVVSGSTAIRKVNRKPRQYKVPILPLTTIPEQLGSPKQFWC